MLVVQLDDDGGEACFLGESTARVVYSATASGMSLLRGANNLLPDGPNSGQWEVMNPTGCREPGNAEMTTTLPVTLKTGYYHLNK